MGQRGKKLTDKQREDIKAYFSSCGNQSETAKKFKVSTSTVRSIIHEEKDEVEKLRTQKREQWVNEAWKTINAYVQHVQDPKVIERTGARDSAILIGTLHDKMIKSDELAMKREEIDLKRQELEQKKQGPNKPDVSVYINALKGEKDVWDDE